MAFFAAEGGESSEGYQRLVENILDSVIGATPFKTVNMVVRNKIYFCTEAEGKFGERGNLVEGIIHAGNENVFQRDLAAFGLLVFFCSCSEFAQGILAVDRHYPVTHGISSTVEADCEAVLARLDSEFFNLRHESAGGNGNFT